MSSVKVLKATDISKIVACKDQDYFNSFDITTNEYTLYLNLTQKGLYQQGVLYYGNRTLEDFVVINEYPTGRDYPPNKMYLVVSETKVRGIYYKVLEGTNEIILKVADAVVRGLTVQDSVLKVVWSDSTVCRYILFNEEGKLSSDVLDKIVSQISERVRGEVKSLWKPISEKDGESLNIN